MPIIKETALKLYYEEAGTGFPFSAAGGGLNATIAGLKEHAFNQYQNFQTNIV